MGGSTVDDWHCQRWHFEYLLASHSQNDPTGHQHLQPRAFCKQRRDGRCRLDNLLEVVDDQQQLALGQHGSKNFQQRSPLQRANAQDVGDRWHNHLRIRDGDQ